eukprot:3703821-Rhodomonas_salina.1
MPGPEAAWCRSPRRCPSRLSRLRITTTLTTGRTTRRRTRSASSLSPVCLGPCALATPPLALHLYWFCAVQVQKQGREKY